MKSPRDTSVLVLLILSTSLIGAAWAQQDERVEITLKLEQGREVYYERRTVTKQTVKGGPVAGMDTTLEMMEGFFQRTTKFDGKGPAEIEQLWDHIKMNQDVFMLKTSFDSDYPELAEDGPLGQGIPDMSEMMGSYVGSKLTITLEPNGKVTKLSGMEALVRKMFDKFPENPLTDQLTASMREGMTDEKMRCTVLQNQTLFLPPEPVSVGATWRIKEAMDVVLVGKMIFDWECTLKAVKTVEGGSGSRVAVILIEGDIKLDSDDATIDLIGGIGEMKLDKMTQEGEVHFDLDKGEVISSTMNQTSLMTVEIPGLEESMVLDQTVVVTLIRKDPEVRAKEVQAIKKAREEEAERKEF